MHLDGSQVQFSSWGSAVQPVPVIGSAALEEALTKESLCQVLVSDFLQLSFSKVSDGLLYLMASAKFLS